MIFYIYVIMSVTIVMLMILCWERKNSQHSMLSKSGNKNIIIYKVDQ